MHALCVCEREKKDRKIERDICKYLHELTSLVRVHEPSMKAISLSPSSR